MGREKPEGEEVEQPTPATDPVLDPVVDDDEVEGDDEDVDAEDEDPDEDETK